jgi:hypothetical protein
VPALLAAACASQRPAQLRDLAPADLGSCALNIRDSAKTLQGTAALYLYVDTDGAVPAAFVHDQHGLEAPGFLKCVAQVAATTRFEEAKVDHLRVLAVTCEGQACGAQPVLAPGPAPLDAALARETLTFADWAVDADHGWGYYLSHQYTEAIAAFSRALLSNADDARAMRGMAVSEAESAGDRRAARNSADRALARAKGAATYEAVARVCLVAGDDTCAVLSFQEAAKSEDAAVRAFELAALRAAVRPAAERLAAADRRQQEAARQAAEEAAAKADPTGCSKLEGNDRAICQVKFCFGEGAKAFAAEQSKKGADYAAADPVAVSTKDGAVLVTIPVRSTAPKKGKKAKGPEPRDAVWTVTLGDALAIEPVAGNAPAASISGDHNACK